MIDEEEDDNEEEDDEDYNDEGEEDIDFDDYNEAEEVEEDEEEEDEEEEEEEDMPPKRIPSRKAAKKAAATISDLTEAVSSMSIGTTRNTKSWSMEFTFPYMIKTFLHNSRESATVDLLVPTVHEDHIHPRIISGGTALALGVAVPGFFPEEERVLVSAGDDNINTNQASAHSEVVQEIRKAFNDVPEIIGNPQVITLPFACEEQIVHWETQLFFGDALVSAASGSQQYFSVLRIDLFSTKRPTGRRNRGIMRIVGSPQLADHQQADDDDDDGNGNGNNGGLMNLN